MRTEFSSKEEFQLYWLVKITTIFPAATPLNKVKEGFDYLYNKYGLDIPEFFEILESQNYECPICKKGFGGDDEGRPVVDHDHKNGKIRGLVHNNCNLLLGHAFDSPQSLRNAANYLEEFNSKMYSGRKIEKEKDIKLDKSIYKFSMEEIPV